MKGRRRGRGDDNVNLTLRPVGTSGLDLFTRADLLSDKHLRVAENIRGTDLTQGRRKGMVRLHDFTHPQDTAGSYDFQGSGGIIVPHHAAHLIPRGPWALQVTFTATRPASNPTGHAGVMIVGREYTDASHDVPYGIELSDVGLVTGKFTDTGSSEHTVTHTATAGEVSTFTLVWDPDTSTGRLLLLQDGVQVDETTSIGATAQPLQGTAAKLLIGAASSDGSSFETNSNAEDTIDEVLMWSWPGRNINTARGNGRSLLDTIKRHARRSWPDYLDPALVFAYSMDGAVGSVLTDWSRHKNDGAVTGCISAAGLVMASMPGQCLRHHDKTNGSRVLYMQVGGETYVTTIRPAS